MKKIAMLFLCFIAVSTVMGQSSSVTFTGNGESDARFGYYSKNIPETKYEYIIGSPFFNEEWQTGIIELVNGVTFKTDMCKYDVYEEKIMFKKDDKVYYFASPDEINTFKVGQSFFVNLKIKSDKDYYERVFVGEGVEVYKDYHCAFIEGRDSDGITPAVLDKYGVDYDYYVKRGDSFAKMKLKEKSVLSLLNDKEKEVSSFIKEKGLNCKKENDVIEVFKYYATL